MNFPDFSEFSATLSPEKIKEICDTINSVNITSEFSLTQEGLNSFATAMSSTNLLFTLEVLKLYHNWLSEKLQ